MCPAFRRRPALTHPVVGVSIHSSPHSFSSAASLTLLVATLSAGRGLRRTTCLPLLPGATGQSISSESEVSKSLLLLLLLLAEFALGSSSSDDSADADESEMAPLIPSDALLARKRRSSMLRGVVCREGPALRESSSSSSSSSLERRCCDVRRALIQGGRTFFLCLRGDEVLRRREEDVVSWTRCCDGDVSRLSAEEENTGGSGGGGLRAPFLPAFVRRSINGCNPSSPDASLEDDRPNLIVAGGVGVGDVRDKVREGREEFTTQGARARGLAKCQATHKHPRCEGSDFTE